MISYLRIFLSSPYYTFNREKYTYRRYESEFPLLVDISISLPDENFHHVSVTVSHSKIQRGRSLIILQ